MKSQGARSLASDFEYPVSQTGGKAHHGVHITAVSGGHRCLQRRLDLPNSLNRPGQANLFQAILDPLEINWRKISVGGLRKRPAWLGRRMGRWVISRLRDFIQG